MSECSSSVEKNAPIRPSANKELARPPIQTEMPDFVVTRTMPTTLNQIQDARLRKLLQLIESDPTAKTQDWALAFNLSPSHIQRLFKQATGVALGQALTEKRLQKAAQLLLNTNMSIKEISYAIGYEHTSSFTRAFEKRFQQAPRRYRMQNAA